MAFIEAITHPLRSKILVILHHYPATAAELAEETGAPARTVRHHLRHLSERGFVEVRRRETRRNVTEYSFIGSATGEVRDELFETLDPGERRAVVDHLLRVIVRGISRFAAAGTTYDRHVPTVVRVPLTLDEEGWQRLLAVCEGAMRAAADLEVEAAERLRARGERGIEAEFDLLILEVPDRDGQDEERPADAPGPSAT